MNQGTAMWMAMKLSADSPPSAIRISSLSASDRDIWALNYLSGDIRLVSQIMHNVINT